MLADHNQAANTLKAGHSGKYLGLGNKSGLSGTHRHSLEKLKEYESLLLQSSTALNQINTVVVSGVGAPFHHGLNPP